MEVTGISDYSEVILEAELRLRQARAFYATLDLGELRRRQDLAMQQMVDLQHTHNLLSEAIYNITWHAL